tara:strand:+ start:3116 stop:3514 length:399 start_codon:yes stop_codon:yes gene_type:complete
LSFSSDLKKFADKTDSNLEKVIRGTVLSMTAGIINRTPVDTGRLRGNWQSDINRAPSGDSDTTDKTGGIAKSKAKAAINNLKGDNTFYFVNNLPYAIAIEEGHSKVKAPRGMVRVTVAEFQREAKQRARAVK